MSIYATPCTDSQSPGSSHKCLTPGEEALRHYWNSKVNHLEPQIFCITVFLYLSKVSLPVVSFCLSLSQDQLRLIRRASWGSSTAYPLLACVHVCVCVHVHMCPSMGTPILAFLYDTKMWMCGNVHTHASIFIMCHRHVFCQQCW